MLMIGQADDVTLLLVDLAARWEELSQHRKLIQRDLLQEFASESTD